VQTVISNQWIDEEIRPDKSYIQNCTYFPKSKQSRINMRYQGTFHCISTLAHELGHGYHYHHLSNQPAFSQFTPLSMAEIASTFAEMLVTKCMIDRVKSVEEKIILLDEKIKNTITYLLKPYANFLFQKKLYEECRRGSITASRLNEFMIEAQKFVYRESLSQYTPITWISNNLFYIPTNPFYNYQYSLGYLFSAGIHAQIQKNQFSSHQYDAFLQDTGCMNLENLAEKHFNIELGSLTFWQGSLDLLLSDIDLFLELTNFINPSKLF
ncbi:MAG TPA: M3 family metallopeptidase, partial [Pseudoneobacillus sp.]|nr:M3 family metallopeptidase [Pseudoneobacillus sp.]